MKEVFYWGEEDPARRAANIAGLLEAKEEYGFGSLAGVPGLDDAVTTDNPYWEQARHLPVPRYRDEPWPVSSAGLFRKNGETHMAPWPPLRGELVTTYSWSIISPGDIAWIREQLNGRGVVEAGAGCGYWAWQLHQVGVDCIAYDLRPPEHQWHPVCAGSAAAVGEHEERALMLVWPPYADSMAADTLSYYRGDLLIYAGEGMGGCTGDDLFHKALEADWELLSESPYHVTYEGIHCRLGAYQRRG